MLKHQLQSDATTALKNGNREVAGVLRLVLAAITSKEKEKRYAVNKKQAGLAEEEIAKQSELTDDEVIAVLSSEVKKRRDAVVLYEKGSRSELAEKEKQEIIILQKYLPEQLSIQELQALAREAVAKVGAAAIKDMGKVMAELAPRTKGKADSGDISKIVKEMLFKK